MANRSVVALDISILLRLSWLDVPDTDATLFSPCQKLPLIYSC